MRTDTGCSTSIACVRCQKRGNDCLYSRTKSGQQAVGEQSKRTAPFAVRPAPPIPSSCSLTSISTSPPASSVPLFEAPLAPTSTAEAPSAVRASSRLEHSDQDQDLSHDSDQNRAYYAAYGRFAGQVAAAINARAGVALAAVSNRIPFVDAPLFGEIDLDSPHNTLDWATELPPRAYADRLVAIYWQYVHPIEPVLNQKGFYSNYEALYSGPDVLLHVDRDVWLNILNVVFGLAVQRQETTPLQQRDEEGNRFFERAWALLRPEKVLGNPERLRWYNA